MAASDFPMKMDSNHNEDVFADAQASRRLFV